MERVPVGLEEAVGHLVMVGHPLPPRIVNPHPYDHNRSRVHPAEIIKIHVKKAKRVSSVVAGGYRSIASGFNIEIHNGVSDRAINNRPPIPQLDIEGWCLAKIFYRNRQFGIASQKPDIFKRVVQGGEVNVWPQLHGSSVARDFVGLPHRLGSFPGVFDSPQGRVERSLNVIQTYESRDGLGDRKNGNPKAPDRRRFLRGQVALFAFIGILGLWIGSKGFRNERKPGPVGFDLLYPIAMLAGGLFTTLAIMGAF
ncbi:hypothetical protein [Sphingobium algorifonticola]|uniref:Uncharacterized protein n=1 Tax=Sphingobium algorifonticola TaxID=2008318 RepID=A0A437J9L7_9SPHN|nr:hypothetical protein [Sphingobium algorifonticola]RVT42206.1 hypothetical protein ENE74_08330 [Sphingobium algorifonticola]